MLDSELAGRMQMITVDEILASYRTAALSEREKGTYFERLSRAFLLADPVQAEQYDAVWTWAEWVAGPGSTYAIANGWSGKDVGIDLVAKLRGHDGYAAIQCKFYDPLHRIAQADLAGFIAVSDKAPFHHRVGCVSRVVEILLRRLPSGLICA
jgi:predicted helicase